MIIWLQQYMLSPFHPAFLYLPWGCNLYGWFWSVMKASDGWDWPCLSATCISLYNVCVCVCVYVSIIAQCVDKWSCFSLKNSFFNPSTIIHIWCYFCQILYWYSCSSQVRSVTSIIHFNLLQLTVMDKAFVLAWSAFKI